MQLLHETGQISILRSRHQIIGLITLLVVQLSESRP